MRSIIIGAGIAGITAAQAIRQHDPAGEVIVYTNEIHPLGLYARKDLARRMAVGPLSEDDLLIQGEAALARQGIRIIYQPIERIFPRSHQILENHAIRQKYDRLLLATGSTPRVVEAPGTHYVGVHQARSYEDFAFIEGWMDDLRQVGVVVIGGGILGLDLAYALIRRGVPTTLVVRESQVGAPLLPGGAARLIESRLRRDGIELLLNEALVTYLSEDERLLDGVALSSGRVIPTRLAVCAVGVHPNTDFLEDSGVETDEDSAAILVNAAMQTNLPDIYAAGTCAFFNGRMVRNWADAADQGRIAGLNMVGQPTAYRPACIGDLSTQVYDLPLAYFGESSGAEHWSWSDGDRRFVQVALDQGRVAGAVLLGDITLAPELAARQQRALPTQPADLEALFTAVHG